MLIVVEGTDRVGKTSLCESLYDTLGGEVMHFGAPQSTDPNAEYQFPLADYTPGFGEHVWIDRHYLGELVWAPFFDRKPIVDEHSAWVIEQHLMSLGAVMVFARRDERELEAASVDEPTVGRAVEAQRSFEREVKNSELRSGLSWRYYTHGDQLSRLIEIARKREAEAASMHQFSSNWLGSPAPDVLVVCSDDDDDVDAPHVHEFCLKQALAPAIVRLEAGRRFVNVHGLWHALGRPRVAPYGRASAKKLTEMGMGLRVR